jgi:hypothetical protein
VSGKRPPIGFGDFLRAAQELDARTPEERKRIAALLGFDWVETAPSIATDSRGQTRERQAVKLEGPAAPAGTATSESKGASDDGGKAGEGEVGAVWVEDLPARSVRMPKWVSEVEPLPEPVGEERDEPPAVEPLFAPLWTRAILFAALAHVDDRGPIDVERTVELLCRREPLTRLPRRTKLHVKNDLQLLIDVNRTMTPFAQDQLALVNAIKRLVSEENVEQLLFSVCPVRGAGRADEWPWAAYSPPKHPGTLIIVLTDLGVTRTGPGVETGGVDEWLRFAGMIRRDGCQLVTLVPFPLRRVPRALLRAMAVIPWDRSTTAGMIQKIRLKSGQGSGV